MSFDAAKYYHERYFKRKSEHKCVYCGKQLAESRADAMCEECREKSRAIQRKRYQKKKREELLRALHSTSVEVIRCKDCAVPHNKWTGCPKLGGLVTQPDFFCAAAKPKGGDAYAQD